MKRLLLDTGTAGDYINRRRGVYERAREEVARGNRIGIGMPVLAELVYGIELSASRDRNMQSLHTALPTWKIRPFDEKAAFEFGRIAAALRRLGRPMQSVDIMVAAIALSLGNCTVVSADSDLMAVPGLVVENWAIGGRLELEVIEPLRVAGRFGASLVLQQRSTETSALCRTASVFPFFRDVPVFRFSGMSRFSTRSRWL
jgi:tRNA(fMet)-specific endonuclease VapC